MIDYVYSVGIIAKQLLLLVVEVVIVENHMYATSFDQICNDDHFCWINISLGMIKP